MAAGPAAVVTPDADLLARFAAIVGPRHALADPQAQAPYLVEWRGRFPGATPLVLRPGTVPEVQAILALAHETRTPLVPQGGNTGLVGGQIPREGELLLSLGRLDRIRAVDPDGNTIDAEAGVTLDKLHAAADAAGRLFPLSLASQASCTVGGTIATNAGGTAVIAYGNMRQLVLGLEVVLADGRLWNGLRHLRKDNTGYDLKNLFIGSEGTLGVVTAAALTLLPRPRAVATAFVAVPDPSAALALLHRAREDGGGAVTSFELMPRIGLDFVLRHADGTRDPFAAPHPWYVLLEVSSASREGLEAALADTLARAMTDGLVADAVVAASLDQARALWRLREMMSEVQRHEGGSIKHDVAVPVKDVPAFLEAGIRAARTVVPDCRPVPFGHLGDGNIHFNISQPVGADKAAFLARWEEMNAAVHAVVTSFGGSISAEHGIGVLKRDLLPGVKDPVEMELMRAIKATLDPRGILNPGKVL